MIHFLDGTCGLLSLLPNMFRHYGWNPGERAMRWFGECLAVKTGNPDITFQEVSPYLFFGIIPINVTMGLTLRSQGSIVVAFMEINNIELSCGQEHL